MGRDGRNHTLDEFGSSENCNSITFNLLSDSVIITNKDILPIKGFRYIHLFQLKSYQLLQNTHRPINLEAHLSYLKLPQNWTYDWQLYLVSRIWILVLCFLFQFLITYELESAQTEPKLFNISMKFLHLIFFKHCDPAYLNPGPTDPDRTILCLILW